MMSKKRCFVIPLNHLAALICFFAVVSVALGQATGPNATPEPLPPEAQEALKQGVFAAKEQDYLLAIRYFQDARKTQDWGSRSKFGPDAAVIYYNLGLAESKIPGRELRAICWFETYLAANLNAPNAAAVKDQIDSLDIKSQSNLSHLIQFVQDAAIKIPIEQDHFPMSGTFQHDEGLVEVAYLWANSGDFAAAKQAIGLMMQPTTDLYMYTQGYLEQKERAEKDVTRAQEAFSKNHGAIPNLYEWMRFVNEDPSPNYDGVLNKPVFLDLTDYLKSLPPSDNPRKYVDAIFKIADQVEDVQNTIDNMLKQLARPQAKL